MCFRPIHISRSSHGYKGFDVPCGCCDACSDSYVNNWIFRSNIEYRNTLIGDKYHTYFITLTYDNVHLPKIETCPEHLEEIWSDDDELVYSKIHSSRVVSCWDKNQVKKFLSNLTDRLQYHLVTNKLGIPQNITYEKRRIKNPDFVSACHGLVPFRYILTCERGKSDAYTADNGKIRFGTSRPHYHAIIFVYDDFITRDFLIDTIKSLWCFGRIYDLAVERNPSTCMSYILKYSTKQQKQDLFTNDLTPDLKKLYAPFNLFSKGIGKSFLTSLHDVANLHHFMTHGVSINKGKYQSVISLPSYYTSSLYYDIEKRVVNRTLQDYLSRPDFVYVDGFRYDCRDINFFVPQKLKSKTEYITHPTAIYDTYNDINQLKKASFYSNYFNIIKNDLPKSFSGVSSKSLYDFIYKELYQVVDHFKHDSNNLLYQCYVSVRNYISSHNEQNHICKSIKFSSNLNSALSSNPNLFYFNPL